MSENLLRTNLHTFAFGEKIRNNFLTRKASSLVKTTLNFFAGRAIDHLVVINISPEVNERIQQLIIDEDGVPVAYGNHEGHPDAMGFAKVAQHYRELGVQTEKRCRINGLAIVMAASWASGHQGADLKGSYDLMKAAGEKRGLYGFPVTRPKDEIKYGMHASPMEMRPFIRKLREGFGLGIFPEASVQGGRHPQTSSKGSIYGMQEVTNDTLITYFGLAKKEEEKTRRKPFYQPVAFHGSFWLLESTEDPNDVPKFTSRGKWSLIAAALGIPWGLSKIQTTILMPFTEEEIVSDLGLNWRKNVANFNRYAMKRLKPGLPPQAHGIYGDLPSDETAKQISTGC